MNHGFFSIINPMKTTLTTDLIYRHLLVSFDPKDVLQLSLRFPTELVGDDFFQLKFVLWLHVLLQLVEFYADDIVVFLWLYNPVYEVY